MLNNFLLKVMRKISNKVAFIIFQLPRFLKYKLLSNSCTTIGTPIYNQPTLLTGKGMIIFKENVNLGVKPSPYLYDGYGYIEARGKDSSIVIGKNVWINNNFIIISESEGIFIGENSLIGFNVEIIDSDFHDIDPDKRMGGNAKKSKITIGNNVFIGNNVKILKGVTIGDNSVVGNSSIVTKSIAKNIIAAGNPCIVIKEL